MDPINLLTFDIEEWFLTEDSFQFPPDQWHHFEPRLEQNTHAILEVLERRRTPALFFLLGWVGEHYPGLVREIVRAGHEIGYHSYHHHHQNVLPPEGFELDLKKGLELLEQVSGKRPKYYRAPYFSLGRENLWTVPILLRHGIQMSSSVKKLTHPAGKSCSRHPFVFEHETGRLWEFPLGSTGIAGLRFPYSGSGYFRIMPFRIIHRLARNHSYNLFYFHPRDFDSRPVRSSRLSHLRNFKNTFGTRAALQKMEKLLKTLPFLSVAEAMERLKEKEVPVYRLKQ